VGSEYCNRYWSHSSSDGAQLDPRAFKLPRLELETILVPLQRQRQVVERHTKGNEVYQDEEGSRGEETQGDRRG